MLLFLVYFDVGFQFLCYIKDYVLLKIIIIYNAFRLFSLGVILLENAMLSPFLLIKPTISFDANLTKYYQKN
jgi:hypothetical protein